MSHVEKTDGCWLWQGTRTDEGYGVFYCGPKRKAAHRVSWELYRGPLPRGAFVRHDCDSRLCVNPDHLILGDHWDNMDDMVRRGRAAHGEKHWLSKATEQQAESMREEYATGKTSVRKLAAKHRLGRTTVHAILTGRTWRRVQGPQSALKCGPAPGPVTQREVGHGAWTGGRTPVGRVR